MFLIVWLQVLANRCVMQVYLQKLPVVFDILNGQHVEHELGTFKFSPVFDSRHLWSLLVLGRLLLQSKHFGSGFNNFFFFFFLHKLTVMSRNYCIPECNFFLHRLPRRFFLPAKRQPRETNLWQDIFTKG